uniref:Uncharacterized protein n=1 Tax=Cacopsylla melanoneura TaxID=428564 RepID=A0A8D8QCL3_9HEMI
MMVYKTYRGSEKHCAASSSSNNGSVKQRVTVPSSGYGVKSAITPCVTNKTTLAPRTSSSSSLIRQPSSALNRSSAVRGSLSKSSNLTPGQSPGKCVASNAEQLAEKLKVLENEHKLLSAKIERVTSILDQLTSGSSSGVECRRCTCSACSIPPVPVLGPASDPVRSLPSLAFKRVFIVSDSMGRDLSFHLKRNLSNDTQVLSHAKSGALFGEVVAAIPDVCSNLGKDDAVIVIAGANDIPLLPPILPSSPHGFSSRVTSTTLIRVSFSELASTMFSASISTNSYPDVISPDMVST